MGRVDRRERKETPLTGKTSVFVKTWGEGTKRRVGGKGGRRKRIQCASELNEPHNPKKKGREREKTKGARFKQLSQ